MAYYPKSQIKTNLYTNGGEYTLLSNLNSSPLSDYTGYYFKTSTGQTFTGKSPSDVPNRPLYLIEPLSFDEEESFNSNIINPSSNLIVYVNGDNVPQTRKIPQFSLTLPTAEDKKRGYFMRYFCKKSNELIYYETSQADYNNTKNRDLTMAYDLYSVAELKWYIIGDPSQVAILNVTSINNVISLNNWTGFIQYFKGNYTQYLGSAVISSTSPTLPSGENIGGGGGY
jgi:hypothetical protein